MDTGPIRRFKINKLYGYKDVEITFPGAVLVLIAGNGSGKTTILNALHAFLLCRFSRLQSMEFESIECEFSSTEKIVKLTKAQISNRDGSAWEQLTKLVEGTQFTEEDLHEFITSYYQPERGILFYRDHPVVNSIYDLSPFDYEDLDEKFDELHELLKNQVSAEINAMSEQVSDAMRGLDIVYLPTYRRIENPLLSPRGRRRGAGVRRRVGAEAQEVGEHAQMNYALEDVEARLAELSSEVERTSNLEYRSASATIIDEALANLISSTSVTSGELPDLESLTRFLSRVSRGDRASVSEPKLRSLELASQRRIAAISELYASGRISDPSQGVLRYFLSRLGSVIEKTRETEAMLQRFVDACNGYLQDSTDEKSFVYEPNSMRVTVVNNFTSTVVPLGQLSSGEKQVISMLSRLYLYNKKNLILIDEPELSLSLDWQRKIIPDMMKSGSVSQLLAITHSPFIFENDLDPFAGAMKVVRHRKVEK